VVWDHRGQLQEWVADIPFSFTFKGPTDISFGHLEEFETFQNLGFHENANYINFSIHRLRWLGFDASYTRGTNINFFPARNFHPFLAHSDDATLGISLRPSSRLRLDESYVYGRLSLLADARDVDLPRSGAIFDNHLLRTKLNYQFSRALSLRAIVDYNATLPNSSLVDLERSKRLTGDLLLTYLVHPGTAIYLGYTDHRENLTFDPGNLHVPGRTGFPGFSTGRQFFLKVSYLLRF
jgi:hypothetical protein